MRHGGREKARPAGDRALIKRTQVAAPAFQLFMPLGAGADAVIGDVIHLAAEGIDREHGVALFRRHQPHGDIKGAAAGLFLHGPGGGRADIFCVGHDCLWRLRRIRAKAGKRFTNRAATSILE